MKTKKTKQYIKIINYLWCRLFHIKYWNIKRERFRNNHQTNVICPKCDNILNYRKTTTEDKQEPDVINCPLCGGEMAFAHPENCMTEGCPNCVF